MTATLAGNLFEILPHLVAVFVSIFVDSAALWTAMVPDHDIPGMSPFAAQGF